MIEAAKDLRCKFVSKVARNIQWRYMDDDKSRGLFRHEVKLDIQRWRQLPSHFIFS
jgi:hypothetical protein